MSGEIVDIRLAALLGLRSQMLDRRSRFSFRPGANPTPIETTPTEKGYLVLPLVRASLPDDDGVVPRFKVKVPFPFVAEHASLPAGTYLLHRSASQPAQLLLTDLTDGLVRAALPIPGEGSGGIAPGARLVFYRCGESYRLSRLENPPELGRVAAAG